MPTNMTTQRSYSGSKRTILASSNGSFADRSVTVDLTTIQADENGFQTVDPGYFLMPQANGLGRIYPYATLKTDTTAGGITTITLDNSRYYKVGDAVIVARPSTSATLAGTWANGDQITLTIGGSTIPYTVAGFVDLPTLAATVAGVWNADPRFSSRARAISAGSVVTILGNTGELTAVSIAETAAAGTFTLANATLVTGTVGTVTTVNGSTNTLTFGSAVPALPIGTPLAIAADPYSFYGITGYEYVVGGTEFPYPYDSNDIPAFNRAKIWTQRCPGGFDKWVSDALPELVPFPRNM